MKFMTIYMEPIGGMWKMHIQELIELVRRGEDSLLQLKERFDSVDALAAEICAFVNSEGGQIVVGVTDDGDVVGMTSEQVNKLNQYVSNVCSQKVDPPVSVSTENVPVYDRTVVVITVPREINKFYMANGKDVWVKMGADKRRAGREEIQRLLQESKNLYADEMPLEDTGISDLDLSLFREFYERRIGESFDDITLPVNKIMHNLKLLSDGKCTLAGLLLFGKKPQAKLPSFMVKAIAYYGNELAGEAYRDSRDITGNIPAMFTATISFLKNNLYMLQNGQSFNSTGILEIPGVALEEAVVNAFLHRNYYLASNIRIFVFDNRVEIISPGKLPNTLTIDSIRYGVHIERNPFMMSVVRDIPDFPYRGAGTGIQRILKACSQAGIKVEFNNMEAEEQFRVIFHRKNNKH